MPIREQILEACEHNIAQFQRQIEGEADATKRNELEELLVRERAKQKGTLENEQTFASGERASLGCGDHHS